MGSHKGANHELLEVYSNPQTGPLPGPPGSYLSGVSAHNFIQIKQLSSLFQHTSTVECRSCVVYAQDNNSLPVWTFVTSLLTHISINSQPFLVGIVSLIPKLMVVELVAMATRCLNGFPRDDGVSDHMSPHSIVTGRARMDYNKIPLEFGSYVQLLDRSTNTIRAGTIGAIALNPTGNRKISMIFPLVSCCSCVNIPSSS